MEPLGVILEACRVALWQHRQPRLEPIFKRQPEHPGVAHYLIHLYDYPALAEKGLEAAKRYAKIAAAAPHAQHMPSHIFTRVGYWKESIASNKESARIAKEDGEQ